MSTAEIKAKEFFDAHNIASMPEDVKRQLIILMQKSDLSDRSIDDKSLKPYTEGELEKRCMTAYKEAQEGCGKPIEELLTVAEEEFPWLSK